MGDVIGVGHGLVGTLRHTPSSFVISIGEVGRTTLHAGIGLVVSVVSDVVKTDINTPSRVVLGEQPIWTMRNAELSIWFCKKTRIRWTDRHAFAGCRVAVCLREARTDLYAYSGGVVGKGPMGAF